MAKAELVYVLIDALLVKLAELITPLVAVLRKTEAPAVEVLVNAISNLPSPSKSANSNFPGLVIVVKSTLFSKSGVPAVE